jgi:hypothetical protein
MRCKKILVVIFCLSLLVPTVAAGKRRIYSEKFERVKKGALPKGWAYDTPRTLSIKSDQVSVETDFAEQGKKSLKLNEVSDGSSLQITSPDFKTFITGDFVLSFSFRSVGGFSGRSVILLLDENGDKALGINCRLDDNWRYQFKNTLWYDVPNLPTPVSGEVYKVYLFFDTGNKRMNMVVNGVESGWIDTYQSWDYITKISFNCNDNHPAEYWIDNLRISEANFKKQK